jgi:hemoglobin
MTKAITTLDDIKLLVNTFYSRVQKDELIGPIFNEKIQNRWDEHLAKMYTFWQTVLLDDHTYFGRPFPPHANLPVEMEHFDRWLSIFNQTVDELFEGEKAEEAKWRGSQMAKMFLSKIEYFRELKQKPLQ